MFSFIAKRVIARNMEHVNQGNLGPTLATDTEDIRFRFPGTSASSADIVGRDQLQRWLERWVDKRITQVPDEIVVTGPPWKMTVCLRGRAERRAADGSLDYANRFVMWGHIRWGRMCEYEIYTDTEKVKALESDAELPSATSPLD